MIEGLPTFEYTPLVERTVERNRLLSTAVIELVSSLSNDRVEDLPPLYEAIDPDILDRAFDHSENGLMAFQYNGYVVSLAGDRTIAVYDR